MDSAKDKITNDNIWVFMLKLNFGILTPTTETKLPTT